MYKKFIFSVAIISAFSFSANATVTNCYMSPSLCETISVVDFNEDNVIEEQSKNLLDWNESLFGTYTKSVGEGASNYLGGEGTYNNQGVRGTIPNQFMEGEYVTVTFINAGSEDVTFAPAISFDDYDDPNFQNQKYHGNWRPSESITIPAGGSRAVNYDFNEYNGTTGEYSLINTSINIWGNSPSTLLVDKVEYTRRIDRTPDVNVCEPSNHSTSSPCTEISLVNFAGARTDLFDSAQLAAFNTLIDNGFMQSDVSGKGFALMYGTSPHQTYTGIQGEYHSFKAGEIVRVFISNDSSEEVTLNPAISFNDPDSKPWGVYGDWYNFGEMILSGYHSTFLDFVFDEETAGDYNLVNFVLNNNAKGLVVSKIVYYTKSPVTTTVK
jgi:hypothetical protein